jgi:hypothetical protein
MISVKGPVLLAKIEGERTSTKFPDNVSPLANVMPKIPFPLLVPVVISTVSCLWNVTGFQIAFRAGLKERTDPVARESRVRIVPLRTGGPVRPPALLNVMPIVPARAGILAMDAIDNPIKTRLSEVIRLAPAINVDFMLAP